MISGRELMVGGLAVALGAAGAVLGMGALTKPEPVNTNDRAAIEQVVREYILSHPEILPEAMANLEAREAKKLIDTHRSALEKPFAGAWQGAADPDVTLVEFFDYQCGYCRAALPDLERLLAEDKKLKVVYRELPILGPASLEAAQLSLGVAQGSGYPAFHHAVYAGGQVNARTISAALKASGVNAVAAKAAAASDAVHQEIQSNLELQRTLNLNGTPSWVVGDKVLNGAVGYDALKKAIADARAARG
jgi:protein-disulfide isomerase